MSRDRLYRLLEHISDAFIEAEGRNLEEAFENAALALEDTMLHVDRVEHRFSEDISVKGGDLESLLYNWLEALLLKTEVEGKALSYFKVEVKKLPDHIFRLDAKVGGEYLDPEKHRPKVEVKAVTYHLMKIIEEKNLVKVRFLLDL